MFYVLFLRVMYVSKFNTIYSRHDLAEILLKLALNTNQSINQSIYSTQPSNRSPCRRDN